MQASSLKRCQEAFTASDQFAPVAGKLLQDRAGTCGLGGRKTEGYAFAYSLLDV